MMRQSRPAHGEIARPRNQDAFALSVTCETQLAAIGIDSLVMTELSGAIGDEFGARVRFADLERLHSVSDLIELIDERATKPSRLSSSWTASALIGQRRWLVRSPGLLAAVSCHAPQDNVGELCECVGVGGVAGLGDFPVVNADDRRRNHLSDERGVDGPE